MDRDTPLTLSAMSALPTDTTADPAADNPHHGQYPHAYTVRLVRLEPQDIRETWGYRSASAALAQAAASRRRLPTGHVLVVEQMATGTILRRVTPDDATAAALECADRLARGEEA